jgi:bifunctional non-homologous end joining protein LigD
VLFQTDGENWMMHRMDGPATPDWVALPHHVEPMRAVDGPMPADQDQWAFEMNWDGVRATLRAEGGRGTITTGAGREVTSAFPELRGLSEHLSTTQALLDGAIVRFEEHARPDREAVDRRLRAPATHARSLADAEPITFVAFDLLHLDGRRLLDAAYRTRRELLDGLGVLGPAWQTPPAFEGIGDAALLASGEHGLTGVIAKHLDSPYRPGERTSDWIAIPSA